MTTQGTSQFAGETVSGAFMSFFIYNTTKEGDAAAIFQLLGNIFHGIIKKPQNIFLRYAVESPNGCMVGGTSRGSPHGRAHGVSLLARRSEDFSTKSPHYAAAIGISL